MEGKSDINGQQPPSWLLKFFRWYCHPDYAEDIEGDLLERFEHNLELSGKSKANFRFANDVLKLFRPGIIRSFSRSKYLNRFPMYKNYFKITWRSLQKQKLYAFINIGGLSVGLTCFILIFLYVQHELSFDRFYTNADQIYRIYQKQEGNQYLGTDLFAVTTAELAPTLKEEFPEVIEATTISETNALLGYQQDNYLEPGLWAEKHFFKVFPHQFIQGNPLKALEKPETIVLTESLAKKIYGDFNAVGNTLMFRNWKEFEVTGIIKDPPSNSSLQFSFVSSMLSNGTYVHEMKQFDWNNNDFHTFFTLNKTADASNLDQKFPALLSRVLKKDKVFDSKYFTQPLTAFHLDIDKNMDIGLKGNPKYVSLFSVIAIIVLGLACINYMNLAIARSLKRATEVGLRKAIGAVRGQLIIQFIGESIFIAFLAFLIALVFAYLLSPLFGQILERPIMLDVTIDPLLIPGLLLLVIVVGTIAGSYPAFMLSSLRPVHVLKGKISTKFSGWHIQKALIIGQYAVAIVLIISSIVIYKQFQFIQNKELGYNKAHVVTIPVVDRGLFKHLEVLKHDLQNNANVINVATAAELPTNVTSGTLIRHIHQQKEDRFDIYRARVNFDYLKVFDIKLVAGRDFSPNVAADTTESIILNETAARAFGWTPQEAVGKYVKDHMQRKVIGVVKDFHMHSMHHEIAPLMLQMITDYFAFIAVKIDPRHIDETIISLQKDIKKYSDYPFEYVFLDDKFDQLYKADFRLGEIFGVFTLISIIIASLGLFGMAAYVAKQKTKEIGIRKVLGASVQNILNIFTKDFLKMVLIGFMIAAPIAWIGMHYWLNDFVYRVSISWWMFLTAGGLAVILALITISSQSLKAALGNPVNVLKNE